MAEVVIPHREAPGLSMSTGAGAPDCSAFTIDEHNNSAQSLNHSFVFPAQANLPPPQPLHDRHPSKGGVSDFRPNPRHHKPSNLSLSTLPPFEPFEFGTPSQPNLSPARSPVRLTPPIGHSTGHKRAGSEFVGGDIAHGGPMLVNKSSTDDVAPSPPRSPVKGPPPSRRGHSHRRSHAISQSDIASFTQPVQNPPPSSDPSTPSQSAFKERPAGPLRSSSHPGLKAATEAQPNLVSSTPPAAHVQTRSRVGFSETLEFVPRPLSTISSETSSSMSTIRANHSVSESFNSFVGGGGTSSPPSNRTAGLADMPSTTTCQKKGLTQPENYPTGLTHGWINLENGSSEGTMATVSTESHHGEDQKSTDMAVLGSAEIDHDFSIQEPDTVMICDRSSDTADQGQRSLSLSTLQVRPKTSPESNSSIKQHRVKSWAEMLLHRKEKSSLAFHETTNQSASPVTHVDIPDEQFSLDNMTFDDDTTLIIEEPARSMPSRPIAHVRSERAPLSPDITQASPMIDLDAALTIPSNSTSESTNDYFGKAATGKRRLHSSGETGGFTGPGMHYHRRAESAPEMEPFERPRYGFPRLGSNPAMEEAIVEEDEDSNLDSNCENEKTLGLGVNIVEAETVSSEPIRRHSGRLVQDDGRRMIRRIATPPNAFQLLEPVEIVDPEEEPRFSTITKSSDESSITPTVSPDPFSPRPVSAPLDSALPTPSLTYGTTPETPSAVSSADYTKTSFDVRDPRIHTARSSMTDRVTLSSSKAGDFSASSIDDVPSLTSSASTMMSGLPNRLSSSTQTTGPIGPTERSASLSAAVPFRSRPGTSSKRASLASLSKLMGGPLNKSKLNIAETLQPDSPEKSDKKRHRISRMMKFWKSKEKLPLE